MSYLKSSNMLLDCLSKSWEKFRKVSPLAEHHMGVAAGEVMTGVEFGYFGF
jgi:hypothetical protein